MQQETLFDSLLNIRDSNSFWYAELRDSFKEIIAKILSHKFTVVYCPSPKVRESCLDAVIHFLIETFSATIEEDTAEETLLRTFERKFKILKKKRYFTLSQIMEKNSNTKIVIFIQNPPLSLHEKETITIRTIESRYVLQWLQTLAKKVLGEKTGRKFNSFQKNYLKNMNALSEAIHKTNGGELEKCFQSVKNVFLLWHRCMKINGLQHCLNCQRTCLSPTFWKTLLHVKHHEIVENALSSDTSLIWMLWYLQKTKRERIFKKSSSFVISFCKNLYKQMTNKNLKAVSDGKPLRLIDATTAIKMNNSSNRKLEVIASELGFCWEFTFAELIFMGEDMGIIKTITNDEENRFLVPFVSEVPEELMEYLKILGMCKVARKLSKNLSPNELLDFLDQVYGFQKFERLNNILQEPRIGESLIVLLHKQALGLLERIGIQVPREVRQLPILIDSIKVYEKGIRERVKEQIMSLEKFSLEYLLSQHPFLIVILEKYAEAYPSITLPFKSKFTDFLQNKFLETKDLLQRIMLSRFLEIPSGIIRKALDINSLQMKGFISAKIESYSIEDVQPGPLINHLVTTVFLCSLVPSEDIWKNSEFRRSLHNSRYIGIYRSGMEILAKMERQGKKENPKILNIIEKLQIFLKEFQSLKHDNLFEESYIKDINIDNILAKADYFMMNVYPRVLQLKTDALSSSYILDVFESIISGNILSTLPNTIRSKIDEIHEKIDLEKLDGILFLILDNASWIKLYQMIDDSLHPDILLPVLTTIPTTTAPGHLSIFLGVSPHKHLIYGNKVSTLNGGITSPIGIKDLNYDWFRELVDKRSIHKVWRDYLSKKGFRYKVVTKHRFENRSGLTCILCANRRSNFVKTEPQLLFPNIKAILNENKTLIIALYSLTDLDIYSKKMKDVGIEEIERAISKDYQYYVKNICQEICDLLRKFNLLVIITSDHGFVEGEVETIKLSDILRPHFRVRAKKIENQRGEGIGYFFPEEGRALNILGSRSDIAHLMGEMLKSEKRIWVIDESNAKSYGLPVPNGGLNFLQIPNLYLFARRNTSFGFSRRFRREHKGISLDELLVPIAIKIGDDL